VAKKWSESDRSWRVEFWLSEAAAGCPTPGKRTYETRKDARTVLRRLGKPTVDPKGKLVAYLCACGGYHCGSQVLPTRQAARDCATRKLDPPAAA
jgi:hypothetical protein